MITIKKKEEDFKSRKEYLVALAVAYLEENGGDTVIYDEAECDGYALAEDLRAVFGLFRT
jgi:hypothetical protein